MFKYIIAELNFCVCDIYIRLDNQLFTKNIKKDLTF